MVDNTFEAMEKAPEIYEAIDNIDFQNVSTVPELNLQKDSIG
ncbi:hypothetical protein [Kosmotoga pacifica]|nr:hypothetical protein [Kosmotoga pacifica]